MQFSKNPSKPARTVARSATAIFEAFFRLRRAARGIATVSRFGAHGRAFSFDPDGTYSYGSIYVGDNVNLGTSPTLLATRATIAIGNNVMFGPNVTIRGGNHRFDLVGIPTSAVTDDMKRPEDDRGVVIEDDVWVGGGATILHGVTLGRGSIVGASAVVTADVPRYCIAAGNPARVIRPRFNDEEIRRHEEALY